MITFAAILAVITFFFTVTASADGDHTGPQTTAEDADAAKDDETTIKNFVLHAKQHFEGIPSEDLAARAEFFRQVRNPGIWNYDDSVYLIMLARDGRVTNHGIYTETLFGDSLADLDTVENLINELKSAEGKAVCKPYTYKNISRRACAVEYQASRTEKNILIGGFDHDENDEDIVDLKCPDYEPAVTAAEVQERQTRESLEDFVEGATIRFGEILELFATGSPEKIAEATKILQCFSSSPRPWKHGSIYLFIMTNGADGTPPRVFLNGLNQELAGSPFVNILDEDGVDVGQKIIDTAGQDGKDGFVEYKWNDPLVKGDEVNKFGMSPGTSPKISYVKGKTFLERPQQVYILGSGIYPKDDDDGCAIAGADSEPRSIVFNMFLIMFSMVLTVSLARFRRK